MAANDELPRGVVLSQNSVALAQVIFPATPGIAWVLKSIFAQAWGTGAQVASLIGVNTNLGGSIVGIVNVAGGVVAAGDWSSQDEMQGQVGSSLSVQFTNSVANILQTITASAYPI